MARDWTPSQQAAMDIRGKMILVSAAAGSGKTSVLTERIIRTLTDKEHPADLSRILVVTFTRAAAAELKARIASALTDALAEDPANRHLSQQLFLLGSAQISTIDAFFQQALRSNFEQLDLPASFRMADESELSAVSAEIFNDAVQELYSRYEIPKKETDAPFARLENNRFAQMMDNLLSNRNDTSLDADLLDFYKSFSSYPNGIALLGECAKRLRLEAHEEFFGTSYGQSILAYLKDAVKDYLRDLKKAGDYLAVDSDAAAFFSGIHSADTDFCTAMEEALESGSYAEARRVALTFIRADFPTMRGKPKQMDDYKFVHNALKATAEELQNNFFAWTEEQITAQMLRTAESCELLLELFSEYEARLWEEKKKRGVLEFDDVRALLYRLLTTPDGSPSAFAKSLSEQYDAVYIDEYQDVDFLQDRIFSVIGENRRFMVGDIKQSIYGFRGSEPSIFSGYRRAMPLHDAPNAEDSDAVCVFMSENFRCDLPVIDFANRVCAFLFSACEKSVGYQKQDDLACSKKPPEKPAHPPAQVETVLFEPYPKKTKKNANTIPDEGERPKREAVWIASEISRLIREERLDDGSPIRPSDIAILVRYAAHGKPIAKELEKLGIPVAAAGAEDILHAPLMTEVLNLLRAVDNPYRDLPLSEYLLSPEGGFTLEELTEMREAAPERISLYDAMHLTAESSTSPLQNKVMEWVTWLEAQRRISAVQPADRYLRLLYLDPRLSAHASAPELLFLYDQARAYQKTSWCGLYGFLEHISALMEGKPPSAAGFQKAADAVTVMTIHHSKGLEFPVVFLASCGTRFNTDSLKKELIFHRNAGCALKLYDPTARNKDTTILREAVKLEIHADEAEETIRTLYVALTRARERMYVTATTDGKIATALSGAATIHRGSRYRILGANSSIRQILAALQENTQNTSEFPCIFRTITVSDEIDSVPLNSDPDTEGVGVTAEKITSPAMEKYCRILEKQESFQYPLEHLRGIPTKVAASKLRPNLLEALLTENGEEALDAQIDLMRSVSPSFENLLLESKTPSATDIGTANHLFLELCDLSTLPSVGVEAEIKRLVTQNFISSEITDLLNLRQLEQFAKSDLMKLVQSAKKIYREQHFGLLFPMDSLTESPEMQAALQGQTIFVQGSIDLIVENEDGSLLLFDYKTDRITDEERDDPALLQLHMTKRHGNQISCYAHAVKDLFGDRPCKFFVYSLPLGRSIPITVKALDK